MAKADQLDVACSILTLRLLNDSHLMHHILHCGDTAGDVWGDMDNKKGME